MTMAVLYRRATRADMKRISEIRLSVRENRLMHPERVPQSAYEWFIDDNGIWVAVIDDEIVGFSAGDTRDGSIWALFMDETFERRGIGRRLFELAIQQCVGAGHRALRLGTQPGSRAERMYRAAGWREAGRDQYGDAVYLFDYID